MCMEVSVRVQLTVPLRPAVLLLYFPVHCLVTNAAFILVKRKQCRFVIFNIILTRNSAAVLMLSEWALIDVFTSPVIFCGKSAGITGDRCNVNWNNNGNNSLSLR